MRSLKVFVECSNYVFFAMSEKVEKDTINLKQLFTKNLRKSKVLGLKYNIY